MLQGCGTAFPLYKAAAQNQQVLIPASAFSTGKKMLVVRTEQLENDILLVQKDEGYLALYLQCTHEGVGLTPMSSKIVCTAHGSVFDLEGKVLKEPALKPLTTFHTEIVNSNIIIHLV